MAVIVSAQFAKLDEIAYSKPCMVLEWFHCNDRKIIRFLFSLLGSVVGSCNSYVQINSKPTILIGIFSKTELCIICTLFIFPIQSVQKIKKKHYLWEKLQPVCSFFLILLELFIVRNKNVYLSWTHLQQKKK